MTELNYNNQFYHVIINKNLFTCLNLIFVNNMFIAGKLYKKYIDGENQLYLIEK